MSLKIQNWKNHIPKIIIAIIAILFLGCIIRIAVWEHGYYQEKEGTERKVTEEIENPDVDETEVTIEEVEQYTVAADKPRYLSIDKLGISNARIVEVGVESTGQLGTPVSIYDVGWYRNSAKPGQGGTMLLDGHNGGPTKTGVFKSLPSLAIGDIITVERGDGTIFKYGVVENNKYSLEEADKNMAKMETSPKIGQESLSLISCTGEWSNVKKTYLSRQFIRAVLVE